ncbi:MAG: translation elongation factor Ts [Ancalomicrobiaceae bacterium]|nr:translation elongation factor Ts [Ancalomicrobiaceae bacterium]
MSISASQVKELRDATGAGMMDCKAALIETAGDMESAVDWLRKKGLSKAAKKSGRTAAEGLIGVSSNGTSAALVEVNSETDFVARNDQFQALVHQIADLAVGAGGDIDKLGAAIVGSTGKSVNDSVTDAVATIGENMRLRRTAAVSVEAGVVGTYVHNSVADGLGKIGIIVGLASSGSGAALSLLGRQIAMHIAAAAPIAVRPDEVDASVLEREKAIFADQARQSGKPEAVIEKMVEGRIRKFYEEATLLKQVFVVNPDLTVEAALKAAEKDVGAPVTVTAFVRFVLGEGIEKDATDFAAEVAAAAGKA